MPDQTQVAAQPAPQQAISVAEGAERFAKARAAAAGNANVSEAARTLGQHAQQARQERQAQQGMPDQSAPQGEAQQPEDNANSAPEGETTNTAEASQIEGTEAEGEAAEQPIDLGDGIILPKEEIRQSILRQADYTRKTQDLADQRKALEAERSTKLQLLDQVIGSLQQKAGQPKTLKQWLAEDPVSGLEHFADQQEQLSQLNQAQSFRETQERQQLAEQESARDKHLAENYNKEWADPEKRVARYVELSKFALGLGADRTELAHMTKPWMIQVLDLAFQNTQISSQSAGITKVLAGKPQVVRPGAKVTAQAAKHNSIQQAQQRLKSSNQLSDAVALLQARRAGQPRN